MKTKFVFVLSLFALSITGCGKTNENQETTPHQHAYDVENVEWSWIELAGGGYSAKAIFTCPTCEENEEGHEVFVDATVTNQIAHDATCVEDGTIRYTAKASFEGKEYTATKDKSFSDPTAHHYVETQNETYLKTAATCTEDAVYYKSCEHCHEASEETFTAANTKLGHDPVHHAAQESTCQQRGNIEYWSCSRCEKVFSDANAQHETTMDDVLLPSAHHFIEVIDAQYLKTPATCEEDAVYYKSCEYCEEAGTETFTVANTKLGHDPVHHTAQESTCQQQGNIEYWSCSRCEKVFSDANAEHETTMNDVMLPTAHDMTYHAEVPATCESNGQKAYYTCSFEPGVLYQDEDGTEQFANEDELVIPKYVHEFNEHNNCIHCGKTAFEVYGLSEATALDKANPITVSDIGLASGIQVDNTGHKWGRYDFNANKAIDLWIDYDYALSAGDDYFMVFLFNQENEQGAILRLQTNRAEDDGIVPCYIYTTNGAADGTTIPTSPTLHYFPRITGVKSSTDNVLHVSAYCVDESVNTYRVTYTLGVKGGTQYYPSLNPEDQTNTPISFDIQLGADYFDNGLHKFIRFSGINGAVATISDTVSEDSSFVVYKDANGEVIGKKETDKFEPIAYKIDGLTLSNWFDSKGQKLAKDQGIATKTIAKPVFLNTTANMFTLSGFGFASEMNLAFGTTQETISPHGVSISSGELDVYFIYNFEEASDADNYVVLGFPFDGIDAATRVLVRINNIHSDGLDSRLSGYIYGSGLGNAGDEGTRFDSPAGMRDRQKDPILVHINAVDNGDQTFRFTFSFTNIVTGVSYSTYRDASFAVDYGFGEAYIDRNKFAVSGIVNCKATISNAF